MGTSKKIQYPNILAHILCTQLSNQLNGNTLNTLISIALNIAAVYPLFSNYDINVFYLLLSCSFTIFFSTSLTEIVSVLISVKYTSSILTNLRPIYQLSILSKIYERIVSKKIPNYLSVNNILDTHQSAFYKHHSTETALAHFLNELFTTLMVLLDICFR